MFLFGGRGEGNFYNTIRVFDTETNFWMNTPSAQTLPEGRGYHSAFSYDGELYIFGGHGWDENFGDLWKFSPESFSWKEVEPKGKGPGPMYRMCCCMVGDRVIFFGGFQRTKGFNAPIDELFILDLSPSLKMLCKAAVHQYGLQQSGLPHNIRWELAAMKRMKRNTSGS